MEMPNSNPGRPGGWSTAGSIASSTAENGPGNALGATHGLRQRCLQTLRPNASKSSSGRSPAPFGGQSPSTSVLMGQAVAGINSVNAANPHLPMKKLMNRFDRANDAPERSKRTRPRLVHYSYYRFPRVNLGLVVQNAPRLLFSESSSMEFSLHFDPST